MKNLAKIVFCFTLFSLIFSCEKSKDNAVKNGEEITILIQPFEDVKPKQLTKFQKILEKFILK